MEKLDWLNDVLQDVLVFCEQNSLNETATEVAHAMSALKREIVQTNSPVAIGRTSVDESSAKLVGKDSKREELMVVSICATCIQANANGNTQRLDEIRETILKSGELSSNKTIVLGYCSSRNPLVRHCSLANRSLDARPLMHTATQ